MTLLVGSSDL